jgi:hypothetical protein
MASLNFFNINDTIYITITSSCVNPIYAAYDLYRDNTLYQSSTMSPFGANLGQFPLGTYRIDVTLLEDDFSLCDAGSADGVIINTLLECIPLNQNNLSFSALADFYDLQTDEILLSGPNDPASGATIFGLSTIPTTGSSSKTRPNAVSELRGDCRYVTDGVFSYEVYLESNSSKFFIDSSGNIYPGTWQRVVYDFVWLSEANGRTTSCPSNNSSATFSIYLEHFNTSGNVTVGIPFIITVRKNGSTVDAISRFAGSNGSTSKNVTVSLSQGDQIEIELDTQIDPFLGNCGRTLNYRIQIEIQDSILNNAPKFIRNSLIDSTQILDSPKCQPQTTVIYSFDDLEEENGIGVFGNAQLYVNNVFIETIGSGTEKSIIVNNNVPVRFLVGYGGVSFDKYINPLIRIYSTLNNNAALSYSKNVTSGVPTFLEIEVMTPPTGVNTLTLNGLFEATINQLTCDSEYEKRGIRGVYITDHIYELGSSTGKVVFKAIPYSQAVKFEVIWNNQVVINTGYITRNQNPLTNQRNIVNKYLTALGEPTVSNVKFVLFRERETFNKNLSSPTTAIVRVYTPVGSTKIPNQSFGGSSYKIKLSCPR